MLEKKLFTGLMDGDSEVRLMAPDTYRYALNIRAGSSDGSNIGAIETVSGNTLVSFTLPVGVNKVVGAYENITTAKIYYLVYNSSLNHGIYEYDCAGESIATVMQDPVLGFRSDFLITGINVIEGFLLYTDDNVEPRNIDIEKGKAGGYPSPILDEHINAIRRPPQVAPSVEYATDTALKTNFLKDKFFQFKYKFHYDNKQRSAWSPISTLPYSVTTLNNNLSVDEIFYSNNCIEVEVETGTALVTRIEIAAREGNTGDFFSIITLNKYDLSISSNSTYTYTFYNDKTYSKIDIKDSIKLFDRLPRKAKSQEIIDETRITYGDILEDFNVPIVACQTSTAYRPPQGYKIRGFLAIKNMFSTATPYNAYQPIWQETVNGITKNVYGGWGPNKVVSNVAANFNQDVPLGGFTLYLAGTDCYGITKQNLSVLGPSATLVQYQTGNPQNVIDKYAVTTLPSLVRDYITDNIFDPLSPFDTPCYSSFEISSVPEGTYVMRIAGHQISSIDLNSSSRDYQRTSANTLQIGGVQGAEVVIEIDASTQTATVGGVSIPISSDGVIDLTDLNDPTNRNLLTYIADLTNVNVGRNSTGISGYLQIGNDYTLPGGNTDTPTVELGLVKLAVYSGAILVSPTSPQYNGNQVAFDVTKGWKQFYPGQPTNEFYCFSDHNGYFFYALSDTSPAHTLKISSVHSGGYDFGAFTPHAYVSLWSSGSAITYPSTATDVNKLVLVENANINLSFYSRTKILSRATDAFGNSRQFINVVLARGKTTTSDFFGRYAESVFVDTKQTILVGASSRQDNIYFAMYGFKSIDYAIPYDTINIAIGNFPYDPSTTTPYSGTYNYETTADPPSGSTSGNIVILSDLVTIPSTANGNIRALKRGYSGQVGLVYYDGAGNRSCSTLTNDLLKLKIPFYTEPVNGVQYQGIPVVSWSIYHQPPEWAVKYQWVRTKNQAIDKYFQFVAKTVVYVNDAGQVVAPSSATQVNFLLNNIIDYKSENPGSQLAYSWTKGDRIRFISNPSSTPFQSLIDVEIQGFNNGYVVIYNNYKIPVLQNGCLFEIYTPKLKNDQDIYYEVSECYDIGNPGELDRYHKGTTDQDTNGYTFSNFYKTLVSQTPATGTFTTGDAYYRYRVMPFMDTSNVQKHSTNIIDDAAVTDFAPSQYSDIGRPNIVSPDFSEVRRPATIYYSEKFIPETNINGLNSFFDTSFESYERRYGSIQKLYSKDLRLLCIQELKCGLIPINQQFVNDSAGQKVLATSDKVLNDIQYYAGEYGIGKNPESFAAYGNLRFGIDINRGVVWQLAENGLVAISLYKMNNYFTDKCRDLLAVGIRPNIYGTYDMKFSEYVISFERTSNRSGSKVVAAETLAFNSRLNKWSTFYSYLPDYMVSNGVGIVSFKAGALYTHNSNATQNNFYGTQYDSEVHVPANSAPSNEKVFNATSEESTDVWTAYSVTTPSGQDAELFDTDYELIEDVYYAPIPMDKNTPVPNPAIEGDVLRGSTALFKLKRTATTFGKLFALNILSEESPRTNK